MPELPEVEVVRAGLAPALTGARIIACEVLDPRALKRHMPLAGGFAGAGRTGHGVTLTTEEGALRAADFERRVVGLLLAAPARRGKFMWIPVSDGAEPATGGAGAAAGGADVAADDAGLLVHLGMSGQMLLRAVDAADDRHVRVRLWIEHADHGELRLDFADQRLFGSLALDALVPDPFSARPDSGDRAPLVPGQAVHIAPDPLERSFDDAAFVARLRARTRGVKQLILDQSIISGVGNIYADEALWRARLHPETAGSTVSVRRARELLAALRDVFSKALAEGGTSFDEQYVNVNGEAGYFAHSLNAYGRGGEPCSRCSTPIRRVPFGGRSSHFCPRCQRKR